VCVCVCESEYVCDNERENEVKDVSVCHGGVCSGAGSSCPRAQF